MVNNETIVKTIDDFNLQKIPNVAQIVKNMIFKNLCCGTAGETKLILMLNFIFRISKFSLNTLMKYLLAECT